MTAHDKATAASRYPCDQFVARLGIDGSNRGHAAKICSLGVATRFAYVYHRRDRLRVYMYEVDHHLNPLTCARGPRKVYPQEDLRSVCANCHAMPHRQDPPLSIEELKSRILNRESGTTSPS
jgi:5-methylcytosine-specific restriction endonuclease McrA